MSFDRHSCFTDLTQRSAPERRSASLRNRCSPSPEYPRSPSTAVKPTGCCRLKSQVAPVATRRKARSLPSISEQYMKFEFTSLRHAVSTAKKFCYGDREIREKGPIFGDICYTNRTRENDLRAASLSLQWFFSGASTSSPVSRTRDRKSTRLNSSHL